MAYMHCIWTAIAHAIAWYICQVASTCHWMQVDLVVFDGPKDDQAVSEEHMTLHKGVWSHQVSPQPCPLMIEFPHHAKHAQPHPKWNVTLLTHSSFSLTAADYQGFDITIELWSDIRYTCYSQALAWWQPVPTWRHDQRITVSVSWLCWGFPIFRVFYFGLYLNPI